MLHKTIDAYRRDNKIKMTLPYAEYPVCIINAKQEH